MALSWTKVFDDPDRTHMAARRTTIGKKEIQSRRRAAQERSCRDRRESIFPENRTSERP
jgi:hypothetical protein